MIPVVVGISIVIVVMAFLWRLHEANKSVVPEEQKRRAALKVEDTGPQKEIEFMKVDDVEEGLLEDAIHYLGQIENSQADKEVVKQGVFKLRELCQNSSKVFAHLAGIAEKHPNPRLRQAALLAIKASSRPEARAIIHKALQDGDPRIRFAAVAAIGMVQTEMRAGGILIEDLPLNVTIGAVTDPEELKMLGELFAAETEVKVKAAAFAVLSRAPSALPPGAVLAAFDNRDFPENLRLDALKLLAGPLDESSLAKICRTADNADESTIFRIEALAKLQENAAAETVLKAATSIFTNAGEGEAVRTAALMVLEKAPPEKTMEALAAVARDSSSGVRLRMLAIEHMDAEKADALTAITISDENEEIAAVAFRRLAKIGGAEALDGALTLAESGRSEEIRIEAINYLAANGGKSAMERLEKIASDGTPDAVKQSAARAIVRIKERANQGT
jgi:HEAT repeat protein